MGRNSFFSLLLIFTSLATTPLVRQSTAYPFIYYYSAQKNEFIVERADGSESRILARYSLPDKYSVVAGPGWSRSGKWFAWTSETTFGSGNKQNIYVVGRDGGTARGIFSGIFQVAMIAWSPTNDLLAVGYFIDRSNSIEKVSIYDPSTNKIVADIKAADVDYPNQPTPDGDWFVRQLWSPDGQSVALLTGENLVLLQSTGKYKVIPSSANEGICESLLHWFNDGRLAYPRQTDLVIEDMKSSAQAVIQLPKEQVEAVDWSPDEAYALIYTSQSEDSPKSTLWLLSLANQSVSLLSKDVGFIQTSTCPDIFIPSVETVWNGHQQAAFTSDDDQLWLVSVSPPQVSKISPLPVGEVPDQSPLRWLQNDTLMFLWQSPTSYDAQIDLYNPENGQIKSIVSSDNNSTPTYFTALNGTRFVYSQGENAFIVDLDTTAKTEIAFQSSPDYPPSGIAYTVLHPNQNWAFLLEDLPEPLHPLNIATYDGSIQRQLSMCPANSASCFGWLP